MNNFAALCVDLVQELREDIDGNKEKIEPETAENITEILQDLEENATKINHHGKWADSIVRAMLLHSHGQKGEPQETDINALLQEDVKLTYHGMRAQNSAFNIDIKNEYDESIGLIKVVPQNLSRAFLNILNNACQAAFQKKQELDDKYSPELSVITKDHGDKVEIRIKDNGNGIPEGIKDDIFNPFFTTKPAGEGTGLGLSICYDIIAKEHGGEINYETEQGSFTEFIIKLPKTR